MRIKKYKNVKRPKIYVERPGSVEGGDELPPAPAERSTDSRCEESEQGDGIQTKRQEDSSEGSAAEGREGQEIDPEATSGSGVDKSKPPESRTLTPRTITCSDVASEGNLKRPLSAASGSTEFDEEDASEEDGEDNVSTDSRLGAGSLWFKVERVVCFLQLLALALDVDGAAWPPLFTATWGWTWFTMEYLRWPMIVLLRRVGHGFSLAFGDDGYDLWFFRDVVGYGAEVSAAGLAAFVLFFVLQMPDYTSHKPQAAWRRRFLTHWFRSSLPRYILNLCLTFAGFMALLLHGAQAFPEDVVTAVTVVGGTVMTASWLLVVGFSFAVHVNMRIATKHDAEYSFMIAMKTVVKIKVRGCLLFLHLAYIPVSASIVRALLPMFDWNDNWAPVSRRAYNHHVWCYFMGFPPQVSGTAENVVLECTSLSGVSMHTLSSCLFLLYVCGLPNLVRYLVRFLVGAFETNDDVIKSFLQAREVHHSALVALTPFPKDALWLARRRRDLALAFRAASQAIRHFMHAATACVRRTPLVRRLPCLHRCRRRNNNKHDKFTSIDSEMNGDRGPAERGELGCTQSVSVVDGENNLDSLQNDDDEDGTKPRVQFDRHSDSVLIVPDSGDKAVPCRHDQTAVADDVRRPETGRPMSRAAAKAMAQAEAHEVARGRGSRRPTRFGREAGPLGEYLRRRQSACVGLQAALELERDSCASAREEYVLALSDFESDHSLEITCWESVVDTAGLICLSESYTWLRPDWKVVECLERATFVAAMLVSQQLVPAAARLLMGALILISFQTWTLKAEPFLRHREALLDSSLRTALILALFVGAATSRGFVGQNVADTFLLGVGATGIVAALLWGDAAGAAAALVRKLLTLADDRVNDLLSRQIKQRSLGLEASHTGIRLLMQWDDLLEQQRWSAFLAWPCPTPANILTKQEKVLIVRWAALRGIDVRRARSSTNLSLLHDAIISAEVEPARWLVYLYPALLDAETLHKESPLLLGVLETARLLLQLEAVQAQIARAESFDLDSARQSAGGTWIVGRSSGEEMKGRNDYEEEEATLSWKIGRLMEIFLSKELQNADIRWNAHQYDLLTEHGEPDLAELAQHLAQAFHLKPPKGYAAVHRWRKRARLTREYLGEATCASAKVLELGDCGLGDTGYKSLLSVCRALSNPATTFTWPSTYVVEFPTHVVKLNLSGNRMRRKSGYRVADMLLLNKTITKLDLSRNALDSQAASEIFYAVRKNQVLKRLNLASNKIGPEVAGPLSDMIAKNRTLLYLDLSDNRMGERKYWQSKSEFVHVPSAGPALGESLRSNETLVVLKVGSNRLGLDSGRAFANGIAKHRSLTSLDLSGNLILPDGGKALALRLNFAARSSIASLNLSDNHLGKKVAKLFSATLKKNRNLRHLDLARNELGAQSGIALAGALRVNRTLAFLSVAGNGMGAKAAKAMAQALSENCSLTGADLSDNVLGVPTADGGDPADVGLVLGQGLRRNATLTYLNLTGNRFPALEVRRVADALSDHPSLAYLDLTGEAINDAAALDIGHLASSGRLTALHLARSALAGSGAAALARAFSSARGLVRLNLSDNLLGDLAARELSRSLSSADFVVKILELARCGLGAEGGAAVAEALGDNRSVEELDLTDNGLGHEAGLALARSLRVLYRNGKEVRPCRITRLDVSLNPLRNEAGVAVLRALINECTRHLDMSYTQLRGGVAGRAIGRLLRCHTIALEFLNVEQNTLGRDGINEIFWALRRNASLTHLDVSDNGAGPIFGTEADKLQEYGTTSINSALSLNQTLRWLDLGTNGLSAECGTTLTSSIRKNRSLASVSLENNLLDDEAACTMSRKLRKDRQIEYLNLNNNRIGWRGGLDLAGALAVNGHLTFLDIGSNRLGEGGTFAGVGAVFGDALVRNKTLTLLNLEGNTLGPAGGIAIAEALHRNNSLKNLNLENNRFDQDVGFALEDLLKVNFSLTKVGASTGEIGLDCRSTINDMLAAREKLLETHGLSLLHGRTQASNNITNNSSTAGGSRSGSIHSFGEGSGRYSDSEGSAGSAGTLGGGGGATPGGRKPASARALRAKQAAIKRKSSTGSGSSFRR